MYQTVKSPTASWADSVNLEPGLERRVAQAGVSPVLCCPAIVGPVSGAFVSLAFATNRMADSAQDTTEPNTLDFTAAVAYIPPGRLSAGTVKVSQNASVEELISAAAADRRA